MLSSDFGTFTCRIIVVAETASGGEMMPPRRKPSASVKPGIKALDIKATTVEVRITIGKAKLVITRLHFQNSFQDTCHAASYNSGGRKIKNTHSGSMVTCEKAFVKLNTNPPKTSTMGYASLSLLAMTTSARIIKMRKIYCIKMVCIVISYYKNRECPSTSLKEMRQEVNPSFR